MRSASNAPVNEVSNFKKDDQQPEINSEIITKEGFQKLDLLLEPPLKVKNNAQLIGIITKRPYATNNVNSSSITLIPIWEYSPRRP